MISEFIYIIKNKPNEASYIYLEAAKNFSKINQEHLSLYFLEKAKYTNIASTITSDTSQRQYGKAINAKDINKGFWKTYGEIIDGYILKYSNSYGANSLSRLYYDLSLVTYDLNDTNSTEKFIYSSIELGPEWSYYYLELANLYLLNGNTEKAQEVINLCKNHKYPQKHCSDFETEYIVSKSKEPEAFGFMKDRVYEEIER